MKRLPTLSWVLLGLAALSSGCATGAEEEQGGFFKPPVDGGLPILPDGGGSPAERARRQGPAPVALFMQVGRDGYAASPDGQGATVICPEAAITASDDGARIMCTPTDDTAPLTLIERGSQELLTEIPDWSPSTASPSLLSPAGEQVATRVFQGGEDVVLLFSDTGALADQTPARLVTAFAAENVLLLMGADRKARLWRRGEQPVTMNTILALPIGPAPVGAIYQRLGNAPHVVFLNARTGDEIDLGVGLVGATFGTRVLVLDEVQRSGRVLDMDDSDIDFEVTLPRRGFDEPFLRAFFLDDWSLQIEIRSSSCPTGLNDQVSVARTTTWLNIADDERTSIVTTRADAHSVQLDGAKSRALVLDVDNCGNPLGTGRILDLSEDGAEDRPLTAFVDGTITAAALSKDGRYLALSTRDGVTVADLEAGTTTPIDAPGRGGVLSFR